MPLCLSLGLPQSVPPSGGRPVGRSVSLTVRGRVVGTEGGRSGDARARYGVLAVSAAEQKERESLLVHVGCIRRSFNTGSVASYDIST